MHEDFEHGHPIGEPEPRDRRRDYRHKPMSREQASEIMIAFGIATASSGIPISRRMTEDERSYYAIVPMWWVADQPEVRRMLDALDR